MEEYLATLYVQAVVQIATVGAVSKNSSKLREKGNQYSIAPTGEQRLPKEETRFFENQYDCI